MSQTLYLAPDGFFAELNAELSNVVAVRGPYILAAGPPQDAAWAQDIWYNPVFIPIASVADGARRLRQLGRFWSPHAIVHHRRAALVQEQLRCPAISPIAFPDCPDIPQIGGWTLWDKDTILAAHRRWKRLPHGLMEFVQDRLAPPNRAYLKLWEVFTLMGDRPGPGDTCLDLGASPGGWTWVLQRLGAKVIAVDKAALAPQVARLPRVQTVRQSAFALQPLTLAIGGRVSIANEARRKCAPSTEPENPQSGWARKYPQTKSQGAQIDWLFSDVVCYPRRLLELIRRWLDSGRCQNIVATVKFQGAIDLKVIRQFQMLDNSNLIHLFHNKHELTWIWPRRPNLAITP